MGPDPVQPRPSDCTCDGDGLTLVSRVPRFGAMPELCTYRCEACGHVETLEAPPNERRSSKMPPMEAACWAGFHTMAMKWAIEVRVWLG